MSIDTYIHQQPDSLKKNLQLLHQLLSEELALEAKIKYGIPFYYGRSWITYLNVRKDKKIELAFTRGNELSMTWHRLSFRDRKQVCSVIFEPGEKVLSEELMNTLHEAILLDETTKYQLKK